MADFNRKDWEDLNITREEVENLSQALKKEEFRKLLSEYAEEITDPKNRKQFQEEIIQLEAERGIDCTFVNPEPGFVVKTSLDGKKKAFINICKSKAVGRPNYRRGVEGENRGLSWSIPLCQAPGREDFDKKRNRCVVYDVVFHPDTIGLTERSQPFKKLVIETAMNAVEENFKVNLDRKNYKLPKLNFKGVPFATVIRKKSKNERVVTEEEAEFFEKIKYPFKPPKEENAVIRTLESKKPDVGKFTVPKYVIKHHSEIDMQEFTYDKNAKINAAIPKQLVIEINLPLLNSTQSVTLDVMKKSLHLLCEKPAKYKLDIHLPYSVNEEMGNAKFDKERRLLIITLPVIKARTTIKDLMREDSGVESDLSPVESISNNELTSINENDLINDLKDSDSVIKESEDESQNEFEVSGEESEKERDHRTKEEVEEFLESDKHYILPGFSCNVDCNNICFVLNVKNVDSNSLIKKFVNSHACHIKFVSIGSGFFPVHYAFFFDFKEECNIQDVICETWDNNVTVLVEFMKNGEAVTKFYIGLNEDSITEHSLSQPLELKKISSKINSNQREQEDEDDEDDDDDDDIDVNVEAANVDEVILSVEPKGSGNSNVEFQEENQDLESSTSASAESKQDGKEKFRTLSESEIDEIEVSSPTVRKSILKKRITRSLSESNADDYTISSSIDRTTSDGSDFCIHEENEEHDEHEASYIKKTVRFNEKIREKLFRVNSSILGRKNKNKKKSRNKKRLMNERRLSESENSEIEEKDEKSEENSNQSKKDFLIELVSNTKNETENVSSSSEGKKKEKLPEAEEEEKPRKSSLKKDDKIFDFKSDLIFSLDF